MFNWFSWILCQIYFSLKKGKHILNWEAKASQQYPFKGVPSCHELRFLVFVDTCLGQSGNLLGSGGGGCSHFSSYHSFSPPWFWRQLKWLGSCCVNNCRVGFVWTGGHLPCYLSWLSCCHPLSGLICKWTWLWFINCFSHLNIHSPGHISTVTV